MDYLSPEILQNEKYDNSVDIWSIGILAFELSSGNAPFFNKDNKKTKRDIKKTHFKMPEFFSDNLKDFVNQILKKNPGERP